MMSHDHGPFGLRSAMRRGLTGCALALGALTVTARAELTTFTVPVVADFEFRQEGGTFLNSGPTTPFIPFRAVGDLTFTLDSSINDISQPTTVDFTDVTGILNGVSPAPPSFPPFLITPNVEFLHGQLTNIVRDGSGEVISADVSDLQMRWEMVIPDGIAAGMDLHIYTKVGLPFDSQSSATIPFGVGTILSGADFFEGYAINPITGQEEHVASGQNRFLTVVPEPSSALLVGLGVAGLAWRRRRGR